MCETFMEPYHHLGPHRKSREPTMPARLSQTLDADGPFSVVHMYYRKRDGSADPAGWGVPALPLLERLGPEERRRVEVLLLLHLGIISILPQPCDVFSEFYDRSCLLR